MRKIVAAVALSAGLWSGLGCAGNAEYVRKDKDGGVIALKAQGDETDAKKLMEKHLGDHYEIVDKYDPKARSGTGTDLQPGAKMGPFGAKDEGVMHIAYRKTNLPRGATGGDQGRRPFGNRPPAGLPPVPQEDAMVVPVRATGKPTGTGDPASGFASEPGAMTPPALYGDR